MVHGLRVKEREVLLTTVVDAHPDLREPSPRPTIWPLLSALAVMLLFIGSIFTPSAVVWGSTPLAVGLIDWFWPKRSRTPPEPVVES